MEGGLHKPKALETKKQKNRPAPGLRSLLMTLIATGPAVLSEPVYAQGRTIEPWTHTETKPKKIEQYDEALLPDGFVMSSLTSEVLTTLKENAFSRLENNIHDTAARIPNARERARFLKMQEAHMRDMERTPHGLFLPTPDELNTLIDTAPEALETLRTGMGLESYGLFVNADTQRMYLIHKDTAGTLEFVFATPVSTGRDGVNKNPDPESSVTKSGLLTIEELQKSFVIPGEELSYTQEHLDGQIPFEVTTKDGGIRTMYIAPVGVPNVGGPVAYRLEGTHGQAIHYGPLRNGDAPLSHGCTRAPASVVATLDGYLVKGAKVYIYGTETTQPSPRLEVSQPAPEERPQPKLPSRKRETTNDIIRKSLGAGF